MTRFNDRGFVVPGTPEPAAARKAPKWLDRLVTLVLAVFATAIFLAVAGVALRAMCGFFSAGWNWCGRIIGG